MFIYGPGDLHQLGARVFLFSTREIGRHPLYTQHAMWSINQINNIFAAPDDGKQRLEKEKMKKTCRPLPPARPSLGCYQGPG